MKKTFLFALAILLVGCSISQKPSQIATENIPIEKDVSARDLAIEEYLLSQNDFSWETAAGSSRVCIFENLEPENELFPLALWVFCSEFKNENGEIEELSGASLPTLLDYPNELSFFDLEKFSHKIPRDGSFWSEDVREIFSAEAQKNIADRSVVERLHGEMKMIQSTQISPTSAIELPENVISEEECVARGGKVFNTLGVESFEGELIGKIEGLLCPCACLVK